MSSLSTFMASLLEDSAQKGNGSNFMESTSRSLSHQQSTSRVNTNSPNSVVAASDTNNNNSSNSKKHDHDQNANDSSQQSLDLIRTAMSKDESLPKSVRDVLQIDMSSDRKQLKRRRISLAARFGAPSKEEAAKAKKRVTQDDSSIGLSSYHSDSTGPFDGLSCKCVATDFNASLSSFMTQLLSESDIQKLVAEADQQSEVGGDHSTCASGAGTTSAETPPLTTQDYQQQGEEAKSQEERGKMRMEELGVSPRNSRIFATAVESLRKGLSEQDVMGGDKNIEGQSAKSPPAKLTREDLLVKEPIQSAAALTSNPKRKKSKSSNDGSSTSDWNSSLVSKDQSTSKECAESLHKIDFFTKEKDGLRQSTSSILQSDNARARSTGRSSNANSSSQLLTKSNSESSISFVYNQGNDSQSTAMLSLTGLGTELKKSKSVRSLRHDMERLQSRQNIYTHSIDGDERADDDDDVDDEELRQVGNDKLYQSGIDLRVDIDTASQMGDISCRTEDLHKSGIDTNVDIDTEDHRVKRRPRSNTPRSRRSKAATAKRRAKSTSCATSARRLPSVDLETGVVSPGSAVEDKKRSSSSSKRRGRTSSSRKELHGSVRGDGTRTSSKRTKTPSNRKSRSSTVISPTPRSPSRTTRTSSRDEPKTPSRSARTYTRDEPKTPSRRPRSSRDEPKTPTSRRHRSSDDPKTPSRRHRSSDDPKTPTSRRQRSSVGKPEERQSSGTGNKRDKSRSRRDGRTSTTKSGDSKRDPSRSRRNHRSSSTNEDSGATLTRVAEGSSNRVSDAPPTTSRSTSRSKRTSRSTRSGSPSARGMHRSATEPTTPSRRKRTGSPSARGKRTSTREPTTPSRSKRSGSPSARGKRSSVTEPKTPSRNKRSGSPSARGKRSTLTEPKTPSTRKTKETIEVSRTSRPPKNPSRESSFSSDIVSPTPRTRDKSRLNSDDDRKGRPSDGSGDLSTNAKLLPRRSKTDQGLLLSPKPKTARPDSIPPSPMAKPALRRSITTDCVPASPKPTFLCPPQKDTTSIFFAEMESASVSAAVRTEPPSTPRVRRASLGCVGGNSSGSNLGASTSSSAHRKPLSHAARTRAAVLAEAAAFAAREKEAEREARAAAEQLKPTTRRGNRRRSTAQAQEVLRQALVDDGISKSQQENAVNPLAAGIEALGTKEEAWMTRRKNRMISNVVQEASKPPLSAV